MIHQHSEQELLEAKAMLLEDKEALALHLRLLRIYEIAAPEKLKNVAKILATFHGREDALFMSLHKKYNAQAVLEKSAEPSAEKDQAKSLKKRSQASSKKAKRALARSELLRIWSKHAPAKLESIDKVMETFKGREKQLLAQLYEKYGEQPPEKSANGYGDDGIANKGGQGNISLPRLLGKTSRVLKRAKQEMAQEHSAASFLSFWISARPQRGPELGRGG